MKRILLIYILLLVGYIYPQATVEISTTDKKSGTQSLKATFPNVGSVDSNYISLPSTSFVPLVAGEKYTIEGWARGTGIAGSDLANGWNFTSGWSVVGTETIIDNNSFSSITDGGIYKTYLTVGKTYKIVLAATTTATKIELYNGITVGQRTLIGQIGVSATTLYFVAGYTQLYLRNTGAGQTDFDQITLQEIILPTITLSLGGQTKSFANISCVPGTFTKLVWHFLATSSEVGQPFKAWANQADIIFYDDASLTERYTRSKAFWVKSTTTGTKKAIANRVATGNGLQFYTSTANKLEAVFGDGTTTKTITGSATTLADGNWHLAGINVDIDYAQLYLDGVADGTAVDVSSVGKVNPTANLNIGYLSADYFAGNIGEGIIFRNYLPSVSGWLTMYKGGIMANSSAIFFARWRGLTDSQFFFDWSGNGNSPSGTNLTQAGDQERGAYPSR